ncbi:MAG: twin-arginine translocase TatA/TatE family subunit [Candidatus Eisenbacteria bacterium]|uniref:Sec-independent protein translocase protein TatA n=1 Tax=Eiseniibacteriota bacterium TaxID=2212470 RepID=A0A948RXX8_UNCEI|nr:twin-arginine translocase TatA/TatE family subunit [Candidatus Eisenbacteria bacterium]MBU1949457.1 twin-arginine translocase TatA/TatE family subunit [Candidatus Eisenbacteria bacterium]MBU2691634.1 twin-arginine translocase TatA/TatE family subunit [Candidatus Eisenbacteria bacterium]
MGHIGFQEILILVVVLVLLFGARRIPELARSMGRGINEFKHGLREKGDDQKTDPPPRVEEPSSKRDSSR